MKLLVLSDVHGEPAKFNRFLDCTTAYSHVLFLGDGYRDAECLQYAFPTQFAAVKGNCDYDCDWNEEYTFNAGKYRIFMTHGHRYGVKYCLDSLAAAAAAVGAQIALYGHTHVADIRYVNGVLCVNPGHVCYPDSTASYAEIIIDGDLVTPKIVKFKNF